MNKDLELLSVKPSSGERSLADDDIFVADAALGMAKLGLVAEGVDESWRVTTVSLVYGVEADIPLPVVPVVEMAAADIMQTTWQATDAVRQMVMDYFLNRGGGGFAAHAFHTQRYLEWVRPCNSAHVVEDVAVKIMERLLEAQGWRWVSGDRLVSPAWLYPPVDVPSSVVRDFVRERIKAKVLGGKVAKGKETAIGKS